MQKITVVMISLFSIGCVTNAHAGDSNKGKTLSTACASCHGKYGLSVSDTYPNLAGQREAYLVKALKEYQGGQRSDPTMQAMVGPLNAQNIEDLAAYFASNRTHGSYDPGTQVLQLPFIQVGANWYQADLKQKSSGDFGLLTDPALK